MVLHFSLNFVRVKMSHLKSISLFRTPILFIKIFLPILRFELSVICTQLCLLLIFVAYSNRSSHHLRYIHCKSCIVVLIVYISSFELVAPFCVLCVNDLKKLLSHCCCLVVWGHLPRLITSVASQLVLVMTSARFHNYSMYVLTFGDTVYHIWNPRFCKSIKLWVRPVMQQSTYYSSVKHTKPYTF